MRFGLLFSAMCAVACSESGVKKFNAAPEAFITSHANGDEVDEGTTETIRGQVADADNGLSDLTTAWLYNGDPVCTDAAPDDAGAVSCDVTFSTDGGEVTLTVRDPSGEMGTARVTLEVQLTDAPTADIASPTADGVYYSGTLITIEGTVADAEDAAEELTVLWSSELAGDLDGDFSTPDSEGKLLGAMLLDEGEHFITLTVTDSTDKEGSDSVVINVGPPNSAPTCAITAPASGSAGSEGETVMFEADVDDVDVPANWLGVAWTSDKDGPIGTSTPDSSGSVIFPYESLTVNTHVITMTVTDEMGADCTTNSVYAVGTPPILNVTAPTDGDTLNHSDAVVFEATVEDNEDLPNEVSLSWESDIDGVFSTDGADSSGGVTVSVDSLSAGDHVVTVTATDTDGLFVTDTVSFNLNEPPTAPTVTLEPNPATTNQMLVATASGSVDPEATSAVTYAYEWFEDGVPSPESSSATFAAAATGKHHTYRVQVTASDGLVESAFGYAEANVINSEPVLSGPTLSAATATVGDVLTCTATATDADPTDSPTVTYVWSDGSTGPTYTVAMSDAVDGTIACTATADDADGGTDTGTASATVANGPPDITDVLLSPTDLYTNDTLTAEAIVADPDGDPLTVTYAFSVNGTVVQDSTSDTLSGATHFDKGDNVAVVVTADDGYDIDTQASITLTVQNSLPTAPGITLERPVDALICSIDEGSTDADGDPISYAFEWDVDGTVFTDTETTTYDDDTVPSDAVGYDETWTCEVTPHDGETTGPVAEATIDIGDGSCDSTGSAVLDTYEYDGMDFYPIDLDYCTPSIGGPCGLPYTAAEQMDAFCQLAGYCEATTWEVELMSSTSCYCWMGSWHSSCCGGTDDRYFITEVTCE